MLYRNTKVKVRSPDGDTDYFDIVAGVLQGDTLAPYIFIICLHYVLRTSIHKIKENGFKLTKERSRRYPAKTITSPSMHIIRNICFNQRGDISKLNGSALKLVDKFTYLGSSVSSTKKRHQHATSKGIDSNHRLSVIWKSDLTDKMKRSFFQAGVVSILLYGCTTWTLSKRMETKLDGNYTRMLRVVLNKNWRQQPQSGCCAATNHSSRKLSKLDEPDMGDTAGEVGTSS